MTNAQISNLLLLAKRRILDNFRSRFPVPDPRRLKYTYDQWGLGVVTKPYCLYLHDIDLVPGDIVLVQRRFDTDEYVNVIAQGNMGIELPMEVSHLAPISE